jgi:bacteriorhodopsin
VELFAALCIQTRMRNLYFGIGALAAALVLFTVWLGQQEREASIDRLEQWVIPRPPPER